MTDFPDASPVPTYLIDRYRSWHVRGFAENSAQYVRLAAVGQQPRAMMVSCCDRYCNLTSGNSFGAGAMRPCRGGPRQGLSTLVFHGVAKPTMEKREWTDTRIRRSRPSWNI